MRRLIAFTLAATISMTATTANAQVKVETLSPTGQGKILYVSVDTGAGSRTADGSKEQAYKDLQAAIDVAPEGSVIRIAQGNYLGKMEQGFVELKKYVSLEGGWNTSFTERNPVKYLTMIRPTGAHSGTSSSRPLLLVSVTSNRNMTIVLDGIIFEMGQFNQYAKAPNKDDRAGAPEGCETGRLNIKGETLPVPATDGFGQHSRQCLSGTVAGNLIIRNCVFSCAMHYGIQMQHNYGKWEVYNNLFVACRMAACEIRGNTANADTEKTLDFHHNTVIFTWTRNKIMEDMGYGFRYMPGVNADVHHNLFGCNYFGALDRGHFDSNSSREKLRINNAYDNLFFANRMGDICLPSGGGLWNWQFAKNFEEVEQLNRYEGNREVNPQEIELLKKAINMPYLRGYLNLTMSQKSNYEENSSMNTFRAAMGMNRQGTETIRVSMYANRYPFADIPKLWGAIPGFGAQTIK